MSGTGGRPGAGKRHGSSWANRFHRKHDKKHHSQVSEQEVEPLLAEENGDVENQSQAATRVQQQGNRYLALMKDGAKMGSNAIVGSAKRVFQAIRKNLTPILAFATILLAMAVVGLSLGWAIDHKAQKDHKSSFCLSNDCSEAGSQIFRNLAANYTALDPCSNFEQYACGGFPQHHKLRPDQSGLFTLTIMAEQNQQILREVLEKSPSKIKPEDQANFKKLKADYDACMDEKTIQSHGLDPLRRIVEQVKGRYPVEQSLRPHRNSFSQLDIRPAVEDMTDVITYMTTMGVENVMQLYIGADDKHPDDEVIFASPPGRIGLPSKEYYKNEKLLAEYQAMVLSVLPRFLGNQSNETSALGRHDARLSTASLVPKLISFETKLAIARPDEEDLEDVIKAYNPKTTTELHKLVPQLSVDKLVSALAPSGYAAKYVIVSSPTYMQNMSKIVEDTPKQIVQAYLVWKTVQHFALRVEDPVIEPLRRFLNQLEGKEPDAREERWRTCIRSCDNTMGWSLSKFYVDKAFSPADKRFGDQIIDDIKDSFVALLREAQWMEPGVRQIAEKKVAAIDKKIGYPVTNPDILDAKALEQYYASLKISDKKHFENGLHAARFDVAMEWAKLGKPVRHDEWGMSAPTVNAYYNPAGNEIVFPAGIMQSPVFYGPAVPQYLTYGAFGAVAGHELSHAFDNNGAEYDETGRLRKWWTNDTRASFDKKTSCFVDQYSKYTVEAPNKTELHVNGKLTLGENVADAGGLHAAFRSWDKRGRPGQILPALESFTKEQTFFLSYANAWCGIITPEAAAQRIFRDPHSPALVRVLGTTSNSADFREAFNCPVKKPTCELW